MKKIKKLATIKDIAKEAQVSMSTVSHVINKTHYVSPKLKKKIFNAMKKSDYDLNLVASSLRSKRSKIIGLIIPEISDLLISEMAKCLENILADNKYNIILANSKEDNDRESEIATLLSSRMIDGLLIIPTVGCKIDVAKLKRMGIPVVFIDRKISNFKFDVVVIDNERGSYEAVKYLIDLGHKKIAFISHNSGTSSSLSREKGYIKALKNNGINVRKNFLIRAGKEYEDARLATKSLLNCNPLPTAIMAEDDITAIGALRAVADMNMEVPRDISIVGFDDNLLDNFLVPRLTTIHYPINEMAENAVEILMEKIKDKSINTIKEVVLTPRLIVRDSAAPPRE